MNRGVQPAHPIAYPSAWYVLCTSDELPRGARKLIDCAGQRLVVFRGQSDGALGVLDAYCPHMGANLADGRVVGDCLQCPFHAWQFDVSGKVTHVPYATSPLRARLRTRSFAAAEYYGLVCAYIHAEREDQSEPPPYRLPRLDGMDDGRFVYRGAYDAPPVKMHLLEFAENSADMQHFGVLHGQMRVPFTQLAIPLLSIQHEAGWQRDPDRAHIAYFDDKATLKVAGKVMPVTSATARITMIGPGSLVTFRFTIPRLGEILLFQTHTPEAPLLQRIRFRWYAERSIPRVLVWYVVGSWISQWRSDVAIWERKIFRARPMLVPEDGPVHELRRWYRQFFPQAAAQTADARQPASLD